MFRVDERVKSGGRIRVCGDAFNELRYERTVEWFAAIDDVVKDFLQLRVSWFHGRGG